MKTSFMLHYPDAAMALRQPILTPVGGLGLRLGQAKDYKQMRPSALRRR